jgi:hypothetical protein
MAPEVRFARESPLVARIVLTEHAKKLLARARKPHARPQPRREPAKTRVEAQRLIDYYIPLVEKGLAKAKPAEEAATRAVLEALRDPSLLERALTVREAAALNAALTRFSGGGLDVESFLFHQAFTRGPAFALEVALARGTVGVRDADLERGYQSGVVCTERDDEDWQVSSGVWSLEALFDGPADAHAEAFELARAAYERSPVAVREALAFVFRQHAWIDALAREHVAAGRFDTYHTGRYVLSLREAATFEAFVCAFPGAMRYGNVELFVQRLGDFEPELWARALAAVLEDTAVSRPGLAWSAGDAKRAALVAACVDAPEVARWMAARARKKKPLAPIAADYLARLPQHAPLFDEADAGRGAGTAKPKGSRGGR